MREKGPELVQIVWEATYRCPSHCRFCYNCWKHDYSVADELELEDFHDMLEKLPPFGRFMISDGEPLVKENLLSYIQIAKKYSGVSILTSGILIDAGWAEEFRKKSIFVQIPLHGMEKTHNHLTGMKNGYREAIRGLAHLRSEEVKFAVTTVANRENIREIREVFELGVALGASELQVIRFMPGGEGMRHQDLVLNEGEYKEMLESLEWVCNHYRIPCAIGAPNIPCRFPEDKYRHIELGNCGAGIDWLTIDPSGRVRICNHSPTILGDLKTQSFEEIWEHPILQGFRAHKYIPAECSGCDKVENCLGGCRAVAETYYGSLCAPDPLMTDYKKWEG